MRTQGYPVQPELIPPPSRLQISPVEMAPATRTGIPQYLPYPEFCRLIDQLLMPCELQLQGSGDPLLHLHFFQMVRYAVDRGMRVTTTTPLCILPQYRAVECLQSGLGTLYIALDAATPETYCRLYGKDKLAKVLRNVQRLVDVRRSDNGNGLRLFLASLVSRDNLAELPSLVQLAHDARLDGMILQLAGSTAGESPFHAMRTVSSKHDLRNEDPDRVTFFLMCAQSRAQALGIDLHLPASCRPTPPTVLPESRPARRNYLAADGSLLPCRRTVFRGDRTGDLPALGTA